MARSGPTRSSGSTHPLRPLLVLLAIIAVLYGIIGAGVQLGNNKHWTPQLGLDLEGGTQIVLTPVLQGGEKVTTQTLAQAVDIIRARGIPFQDTPDTYYEMLPQRIEGHGEDLAELEKRRILMDGAPTEGQGLLLQIFTQNVIGPIFFEIIQRKGNEGFGEGNFRALFESIELDQERRGVI